MKKQLFTVGMVAFFLLLDGSLQNDKTVSAAEQPTKATWLWHTTTMSDEATIQFLLDKDVTTVYLQIDQTLPYKQYASFIKIMHGANIQVHALDGSPTFNKSDFNLLLKWIQNYNKSFPQYKLKTIHLDVEPYLTDLWTTNEAQVIIEYQTLMAHVQRKLKNSGMRFEVDIPFWFDLHKYNNAFGKGNLAQWIISKADSVTIMAYRDTADAIIDITKNEIAYGKEYNTNIVIGVETLKSAEGDCVSFAEEGEAYMNRTLRKVHRHYKSEPRFSGFSIHYVQSWQAMSR